jgi:hypothetical protein
VAYLSTAIYTRSSVGSRKEAREAFERQSGQDCETYERLRQHLRRVWCASRHSERGLVWSSVQAPLYDL